MAKRPPGRKVEFVRDQNGNPVVGLRTHKKPQRNGEVVEKYYAKLPNRKRRYFGSSNDLTDAIFQFRKWEAARNRRHVNVVHETDGVSGGGMTRLFDLSNGGSMKPPSPGVTGWGERREPIPHLIIHEIPEDVLWSKFAQMLREAPAHVAAQKLGVPELARLRDLPPVEPPASCKAVLELYLNRRKEVSPDERRKILAAWNKFVSLTRARTLADVAEEGVDHWEQAVFAEGRKPKTIRHRVQRVIRVIRYAERKQLDAQNASRVLGLIRKIDLPSAQQVDPSPIPREAFHCLYKLADAQWKCILLTALNCAYYPVDIINLQLDFIDLKARWIRFRRQKTGIARVAILWPETVRAIEEYRKVRPKCGGALVISARGIGFSYDGFRDAFDRLKRAARLPDVTFDQVRDGALTAASQVGVDSRDQDILAGHRCGMKDNYILRNPQRTQAAVAAIRDHYRIPDLVKRQKPARRPTARGRKPQDR